MVTPKKPKPHKKRGAKPKKIDYKKLFHLASLGMTDRQIADCLRIHPATFIEKREHIPEFSEALTRGRAEGIHFHTEQLKKQARNGNYQATSLFLRSHGGQKWQDRSKTEARITHQGNPNQPVVTESLVKVNVYIPDNKRDKKTPEAKG